MLCSENVAKVFEYLLEESKKSSPVVVNQKEIADAIGVNLPVVSTSIKSFKDYGFIRIKKGAHSKARAEYYVNSDYEIIDRSKPITKWRYEITLKNCED